jgi:hypothetical protein
MSAMTATMSMQLALNPALLTVHNRRADGVPVQLVLFKRNTAANESGPPIAWKVMRCTATQPVCLNYPFTQQLGAFDPQGAHVGMLDAVAGERFRIAAEGNLRRDDGAAGPDEAVGPNMVAVHNGTAAARLDVLVYKDGRPLCRQPLLEPGATARFELLPVIYAGVVQGSGRAGEGLVEGGLVDAVSAASAVRLSMLGLASADLVIETDGGKTELRLAKLRFN